MKRLIERVVARVSIVGLLFVSGCAALIGADFDKELEPDAVGGTNSGGTSSFNTGGVITSGGATSDGGSTSGGTGGATGTGGASAGGTGVGGSGAGGDSGGSSAGGSGASNTGGVGTGGTSVGGSGGAGTGGTVGTPAKVVINEVYGYGEQFIELFNYGSLEYDLSAHSITDSNGDAPNPPLQEFPNDTKIAPGEYLRLDYGVDFSFNITNSEMFYLLNAFGDVVTWLEYPGDTNVPEGASYGRDPNGTGDPKILSTPTPGEAN